jgi:hypothetical protein
MELRPLWDPLLRPSGKPLRQLHGTVLGRCRPPENAVLEGEGTPTPVCGI